MPTTSDISDEDLLRLPQDGQKYELVDGEIRVSPAGARHGQISVRLLSRLEPYVQAHRLGHVFESSTGFRWPGRKPGSKNLRSPDVSFVAAGRFPDEKVPVGFIEFVPGFSCPLEEILG
jgi:Uma2 family endonuclease